MNPTPTPEPQASPAASRRNWLLAAVAAAAAASGAGLSWLRLRPDTHASVGDDFWSLRFDTPDGQSLTMADFQGRPLLVNFWATWCPPCIEELPLLDRYFIEKQSSGWQMLGLAVDQLEPVQRFLARRSLQFPMAMVGMDGVALSKDLGNGPGGLPFTVVFDAEGHIRHRKLGQLKEEDLQAWMT